MTSLRYAHALNSPAKSWRRASRSSATNLGVLRCQPILQFIERFDRRKHWHWDFDSVLRHSGSVSAGAPKSNRAASHASVPKWSENTPSSRRRDGWALAALIQGFGGADTVAFSTESACRGMVRPHKILKEFRDEILFAVWMALEEVQADR